MLRAVAFALALSAAGTVLAAEPDPDCDTATFPSDLTSGVALATVIAAKTPFLRNPDGCPDAGDSCAEKAFVVAGDKVVTAQTRGLYRCVAFAGKRGQTTGWVRQDQLTPAREEPLGDWTGRWKRVWGSATLSIRRKGTVYTADMLATATTANPENVRTGVAAGDMKIDGTKATFGEESCHVEIHRLGAMLVVNDGGTADVNSDCDGMGVTLNGLYRR